MSIVAEFTIPADAVPGGSTLETMPDAEIELERIVPSNTSVLPYFWLYGVDANTFLANMEEEPGIENIKLLLERERSALFEAEWHPDENIIDGIKRLQATIMEAIGTSEGWDFQIRADNRRRLVEFQQIFGDQGIPVELNRIFNLAEIVETTRPLTVNQRETLRAAFDAGYFDEPRQVTQQDLAEEFGISARAISKRLLRGTRNLIAATLVEPSKSDKPK